MRYKILSQFILLFFTVTTLNAQSSFEIDKSFSQIVLKGALRATLVHAETPKAVVTVYGPDAGKVDWNVKNGKLSVTLRVGVLEKEKSVADVTIYYSDLSYIGIEGATIDCEETITSENLKIETLGGINNLFLSVGTKYLDIVASGDSHIKIKGSSENINVSAIMGAKVDCIPCGSVNAVVYAKQRSEVEVNVTGTLVANASTGANIFYMGNPIVNSKKSMGGGIVAINMREETKAE